MGGRGETESRVATLPVRLTGRGASGRWRLSIEGCDPLDVVIDGAACRVEPASAGPPAAEIFTDPETWAAIDDGRSSGIEAFSENRLWVRGSIQRALEFESLFERPRAGGLTYEVSDVEVGAGTINTLFAGDAASEPLLLLHGLGATKSVWLTIVPELARRYRVILVDLPGHGYSSKPYARYDAAYYGRQMFAFLDALGVEKVLVAGNSMGGGIAMEMALQAPGRVAAIACLCPTTAFMRRPALTLVRLMRPEFAVAGMFLPRARLKAAIKLLFADPGCLDERWYDAAIDEFFILWRSARFRMAFAASARRLYLVNPEGKRGFWRRLATMRTPAYHVYGAHDVLIKSTCESEVVRALPSARVEVWDDCGHVPQIEFPERTVERVVSFFDAARAGEGLDRPGRAGDGTPSPPALDPASSTRNKPRRASI